MLAGLLKGPNYFNPDRHPDRMKDRLAYVLGRMQEDGVINGAQKDEALAHTAQARRLSAVASRYRLPFRRFPRPRGQDRRRSEYDGESYTVHSTINAQLQRTAETALQEGLSHYEISTGRVQFHGPEANLGDAVQKALRLRRGATAAASPAWRRALRRFTCRSTTCTGRRWSWCRRATAEKATIRFASGCPTDASCR